MICRIMFERKIFKCFDDNRIILNYIKSISDFKNELFINPVDFHGIPDNQLLPYKRGKAQKLNDVINKLQPIIKEQKPRDIFSKITPFIDSIRFISDINNEFTENLVSKLDKFIDFHTNAYSEISAINYYTVISKAYDLIEYVNIYDKLFREEAEKQDKKIDIPKDYTLFSFYSDINFRNFDDVIYFHKAIFELYETICKAIKVDVKDKPLIVRKIVFGSDFFELLGYNRVIEFLEKVVFGVGTYFRDLHTGKIKKEKFLNDIECAKAVIELKKIADDNGIDNFEVLLKQKITGFGGILIDHKAKRFEVNNIDAFNINDSEPLLIDDKSHQTKLIEQKTDQEK
ncbi:Uncharacterized protein dnl_47230 [Desulfonema limicola]|uniref:Uncharacterized protein n=1 Tax=Desulfonema limicola TaxID=45656 RepID=A0A975GIH5_9BACT|nr:hypothetical protein [Desulfonema limicola]QTA82349.1 Uncharacterized protein dnl_47230 [Desulfonema limicola]